MDINWFIITFVLGKLCFYYIFHHAVTSLFNDPLSWLIRCPFISLHALVAVFVSFLINGPGIWDDTITRRLHVNISTIPRRFSLPVD